MKDEQEAQRQELVEGLEKMDSPEFWRETLNKKLSPILNDPALRAELDASLGQLHAELLKVFWFLLSYFSPEVLAQVLHDMKLLHLPRRAIWKASLSKPVTDQDRETLLYRLNEDYQAIFKTDLVIAGIELKNKVQALPEASVMVLNSGAHSEGSRLLMAKALGLPGLPSAKEIVEAYYHWFFPGPER